jgi:hypothetical protein
VQHRSSEERIPGKPQHLLTEAIRVFLTDGRQPFRVHFDPAHDGAEIVNGVAEPVRAEVVRNMGLADLLKPSSTKVAAKQAS